MNAVHLRAQLSGGDRRSTGRADEVAADVLANPVWFGVVFEAMFDDNEVVRMRAADAVEKITIPAPELLQPFKANFLARLPGIQQQEVRWHAAQFLPRFSLTHDERDAVALPVLRHYLRDRSRIVINLCLAVVGGFRRARHAASPGNHRSGRAVDENGQRRREKPRAPVASKARCSAYAAIA